MARVMLERWHVDAWDGVRWRGDVYHTERDALDTFDRTVNGGNCFWTAVQLIHETWYSEPPRDQYCMIIRKWVRSRDNATVRIVS